jgi:hypothetical protein
MIESRRLLVVAAALTLTVGVGVVSAQTVIIRNAPAGSNVELVLNTSAIGSAKVDSGGYATLPVSMSKHINKTETDALIFLDTCETTRRVLIVERSFQPPSQDAGCTRRDMGGLFLLKGVSTMLIDVGGPSPTLLLRQGPVSLSPSRVWRDAPTGLVVFGGGGFTNYSDFRAIVCGNATSCGNSEGGLAYTVGVAYWILPFVAAEGTYLRPKETTVAGSGTNFTFTSSIDAHVFTIAGVGGIPVGPVRFYGKYGATFLSAITNTTNTIDGAAQSFGLKSEGWSWMFGGGGELWIVPHFGIYGEFGRAQIKGSPELNVEGGVDDHLTSFLFGARVRLF